jgi:hypothetical protein
MYKDAMKIFNFVFLTESLNEAFIVLKVAIGLSVLDILQVPLKNRSKPPMQFSDDQIEKTVHRTVFSPANARDRSTCSV